MKTDPDYRLNQGLSQKQWAKANAGYWKQYRRKNPDKAQRNRILQTIRNRKARGQPLDAKIETSLIAKMDALKVNILKIPTP